MSRVRPRYYYAISLLGLILFLWGLRCQLRVSMLPSAFDRDGLAYPAVCAGAVAGSSEQLRFLAEGWPPGSTLRIVAADGGEINVTLDRAHTSGYLVLTCLSGLFFWGVATFIFAPRVGRPGVREFYWISFLYGLAVMIGGVYYHHDPDWLHLACGFLQIACLACLPVVFVGLTLAFPRHSEGLARWRRWLPVLWLLAGALILWQGAAFWSYFREPGPPAGAALVLPQQVADTVMVVQVALGCFILYWSYSRLELTRERKQVRWLFWGFSLGAMPYVFLRTLPSLCGLGPLLPASADRVLEMALPTAFVFAVIRHQFLDIDVIIRRSLLYAILAAGTVILYLAGVVALGRQVEAGASGPAAILLVVIGLVAGVAFHPLRCAIGGWVDRTFFKLEHDHEQALRALERDLDTVSSQSELAGLLARCLGETLRPQSHAVLVPDGEQLQVAGDENAGEAAAWLACYLRLPSPGVGILAAAHSTSLPEVESSDFPGVLAEAGFVVAMPLGPGEEAGLFLLGRRQTERRYLDTDLSFLERCAVAATAALARIRLVQQVAEETLARRRLDELNRLKSDFLSRVAHDLRTPLASISWSVANLLDGVAGDLSPNQAEYLQSMQAAASLLNRLVENLLEISRFERGVFEIERERIELLPVLEQAVLTVKPLAVSKRVTFELQGEKLAQPVHGNAEKLTEVVVNLLENAVKFSPPDGEVTISITAGEADWQEFVVRDQGPGLDQQEGTSLFARFEQGRPSPYSQQHGFGLGLYIVKSYLEMMGGEVSAANHPDGGAIFTCRLPGESPPAAGSPT